MEKHTKTLYINVVNNQVKDCCSGDQDHGMSSEKIVVQSKEASNSLMDVLQQVRTARQANDNLSES
jgi:hypothetical protein